MASPELNDKSPRKQRNHLTSAQKQAIIAACAAGGRKQNIAKEFGILPQSLSRLIRDVKNVDSESNPLRKDWKGSFRIDAQNAVTRGMRHDDDPIGAANIGLKVLYGIGDLVNGSHMQVDGNVGLTVSWMPIAPPEYGCTNESQGDVIDVPSNALTLSE